MTKITFTIFMKFKDILIFQTYQTRSRSVASDAMHFISHFGGLRGPCELRNIFACHVFQAILLVAYELQARGADLVANCNWALQEKNALMF